jgi:tripartite ATP-independent transporter DctM subunit
MSIGIVLLVSFLVLLLIGVPISASMGIATLLTLFAGHFNPEILPLQLQNGASNYTLIAIPYFILAGNLMNSSGISHKIFDFANSLIGFTKGGLAQVNVLASMIFSGISGSSTADAAGLGLIEIEAMEKKGYDKPFSVAITLASSVIGPIIPPSISFIIYAMLAEVSVAKLFAAGLIPGIIVGIMLMIANYLIAKKGEIAIPEPEPFDIKEVVRTFKTGFFAIMAPAILLGGILSGVITPTETGIIAVVYSIIVGLIYRELTLKGLVDALKSTVTSTAVIMYMIGMGKAIGWIVTIQQMPQQASSVLLNITDNKYIMLLIINVFLLILGMFLEGNTIKLIMVPLLLPIIDAMGISRIHFGVIQTLNALIGITTPPVGLGLFVMSTVTDMKITQIVKAFKPFYIALLLALIAVTYIPFLTTWLPSVLF